MNCLTRLWARLTRENRALQQRLLQPLPAQAGATPVIGRMLMEATPRDGSTWLGLRYVARPVRGSGPYILYREIFVAKPQLQPIQGSYWGVGMEWQLMTTSKPLAQMSQAQAAATIMAREQDELSRRDACGQSLVRPNTLVEGWEGNIPPAQRGLPAASLAHPGASLR